MKLHKYNTSNTQISVNKVSTSDIVLLKHIKQIAHHFKSNKQNISLYNILV